MCPSRMRGWSPLYATRGGSANSNIPTSDLDFWRSRTCQISGVWKPRTSNPDVVTFDGTCAVPNPRLTPLRIGISRCLLGEPVRYDGGHKHDRFLTDVLGKHVEFVPVCPEVEMGLGTPREPIQLVELAGEMRLRGVKSQTDHTAAMRRYARRRVQELAELDLCGYILKNDSPSCGMERVKVYQLSEGRGRFEKPSCKGRPVRCGVGLFAEALLARLPNLPV